MPPRTLSSLLSFSTPKGPPSASRPFASVFSFARARPSRLFPSPSRPYHTRLSSPPSLLPHARRDALLVHQCASAPSSPIVIGRTRAIHSTAVARHGSITRPEPGTGIKLHFKDSKGKPLKTVEVNEGDDILSIAHEHDIDLEGACEGSVACSTCHVILSPEHYEILPEPEDDENDMLDMAFGLTDTSRLGCQVRVTRDLDGMSVMLPSATRNMFVDGKKPAHH
ncbi:hypothetical protein AcW1_002425 [Taiwanofungus camphoratus]|nr:hypothetical protein AcV7_005511 [Antrodia cinnamomea]KAI0943206.1 hypothetical protein AcW1_002425 [Antrodia cinnamomea]